MELLGQATWYLVRCVPMRSGWWIENNWRLPMIVTLNTCRGTWVQAHRGRGAWGTGSLRIGMFTWVRSHRGRWVVFCKNNCTVPAPVDRSVFHTNFAILVCFPIICSFIP
jgi:hypothetical protein